MWWTHGETHVVNACGETPPVAPPHPCSQSARTCGRRSLLRRHASRSSAAFLIHAERERTFNVVDALFKPHAVSACGTHWWLQSKTLAHLVACVYASHFKLPSKLPPASFKAQS